MQVNEVRAELAALWQSWLERVLAALLAVDARSTDTEAAALQRLQVLQQFLPVAARPTLPLAEDAPYRQLSGVELLCALLRCQSRLRQQDAGVAIPVTAVVVQHLQQGLLKAAQACRHSDWTLAGCVASGLARQCRELTLLSDFAGNPVLAQQVAAIEAQLLVWHAGSRPPSTPQQALVQKQLLALARGRTDLCQVLQLHAMPTEDACLLPQEDVPLEGYAWQECIQLAALLQPALAPAACSTQSLMFACYRLSWVLQALGRRTLAEVGLLAYQLLVQHWQQRAPLQLSEQELLAAWLMQLECGAGEAPDAAAQLRSMLGAALACWPGQADASDQPAPGLPLATGQVLRSVLLARQAAHSAAPLAFRHLPEYLAASLSALLQVDPAWFADRRSWQPCATLLHAELQLLEQGAAALRLQPLEQFCSLLLGVYLQLDESLPQGPWPGSVLWRAHHELVAMLDRAALWLEPLPAADTLAMLRDALQQGEERCLALLRSSCDATPLQRLACAVAVFGQQAGRLLGRPLRIGLTAAAAVCDRFDAALQRTLQEVLRWLLLQHESSTEARRSQRQALAATLAITVAAPDDSICEVTVLEAGVHAMPGDKALQRLRRTLGPGVVALGCEAAPQVGRRVHYSLSAASLSGVPDQHHRGERLTRQN